MKDKYTAPRSTLLTVLLLLAAGFIMSGFSLALSGRDGISWGGNPILYVLNTLPIMLCLFLVWLASGQAWLAHAITGVLIFLLTGGNYFKLIFRDDPVLWSDLHRLREGFKMSGQYHVTLTGTLALWIVVLAAVTVLLFFFGRGKPAAVPRLLTLTLVGMVAVICFYDIYPSNERYTVLAGDYAKNKTEAYTACGVVYPFFHSAGAYRESDANYDEAAAQERYNQYQDAPIPEEKKVNLIGLQLEAFADFSLFDIEGISDSVYADYHYLQSQSYTGTLVTDIFAGGTAESEWAVLTGGNIHDDFKVKTDTVAWYLKDQGYTANGSHPCRAWFYDRANVNPNLGLDDYLFTDNYFNKYTDGDVVYDDVFFPDLEGRLTEYFKNNDAPLFSFNVTYQGHGPYNMEKTYWGSEYYNGPVQQSSQNALNNYFHVIQDTSAHLVQFTEYLNALDEPVVLFMYGDHKPWMGNHGCIYEELGINMDTNTPDGFINYYSTQYVIWANDKAKEILGCDFQGEGPMLSPCFLMNQIFEMCGWEGSAYMQGQRETAHALPVLHTTGWVMENGTLTPTPSPRSQALIDDFQSLSRYDRTRFN